MKTLVITVCDLLLTCCCHAQGVLEPPASNSSSDINLTEALPLAKARLQEIDHVGGFAGFAITPTPFLKLSVVFIEAGDRKLFNSFLASKSPTIQAMGLACLSQTDTNAFATACRKLERDRHELNVWTGCCLPSSMTLGGLATELRQNRNFLGHADNYWDFQKFRDDAKRGFVPRDLVTSVRQEGASPNAAPPHR